MFHKGLNREQIASAARNLIAQSGYDAFSMRQLAEHLGVKTASLYAHVESMEALLTDVGLLALQEQRDFQLAAVKGKTGDEAVLALADAYQDFARQQRELYRFIMQMPTGADEALKQAAEMVVEPAMQVLNDYRISDGKKMHWQRILRGVMHGFISQEENGYFSHYPVDVRESYHMAVRCVIEGLHAEEANGREQ